MGKGLRRILNHLTAALAVAFAFSFALPAYGYSGWDGEGRREERKEQFAEELGLTQQQKEAMEAQKEASRAERRELYSEMKASRRALADELKKPETDRAAIDRIAADIKNVQGRITDHRIESFLATKEILTPEQFEKMAELNENRKNKHFKRGKPGREGKRSNMY